MRTKVFKNPVRVVWIEDTQFIFHDLQNFPDKQNKISLHVFLFFKEKTTLFVDTFIIELVSGK